MGAEMLRKFSEAAKCLETSCLEEQSPAAEPRELDAHERSPCLRRPCGLQAHESNLIALPSRCESYLSTFKFI